MRELGYLIPPLSRGAGLSHSPSNKRSWVILLPLLQEELGYLTPPLARGAGVIKRFPPLSRGGLGWGFSSRTYPINSDFLVSLDLGIVLLMLIFQRYDEKPS
jgi:hypothetical protein